VQLHAPHVYRDSSACLPISTVPHATHQSALTPLQQRPIARYVPLVWLTLITMQPRLAYAAQLVRTRNLGRMCAPNVLLAQLPSQMPHAQLFVDLFSLTGGASRHGVPDRRHLVLHAHVARLPLLAQHRAIYVRQERLMMILTRLPTARRWFARGRRHIFLDMTSMLYQRRLLDYHFPSLGLSVQLVSGGHQLQARASLTVDRILHQGVFHSSVRFRSM
jgi:hypothetical protein